MRNVTILDSRARRLNDRLKLDSDRFTSEKQGPKSKVLVEEHSSVRTIILNRPKQLNALSSQMTTKGSFIVLIVGSIADKSISGSSDKALEGSNTTTDIPSWLFVDTKAKVMELVDKITKLVNDLFQPPSVEEKASKGKEAEDNFQKIVKSSLMLSILVLLIVVVIRVRPT